MKVDFPEPDGPDQEDELALGDLDIGVAEGDGAVLVGLGDVLQRDHGGGGHRPRRQTGDVQSQR